MSTVEVRLESTAFEPGSEVMGQVWWDAGIGQAGTLMISLLWHTAGKGTEDVEIVDQQEVQAASLQGSHAFTFRLPDFPWSFSGSLVSLVWAVEASLEPDGAVHRVDLVSAPGAEEIRL